MPTTSLLQRSAAAIAVLCLFLSYAADPPVGNTGAPFDSACTSCHMWPGNYTGSVLISGLPSDIQPNTTYPLTITVLGNCSTAGFQLVAVDGAEANCGTLAPTNTETGLDYANNRTYAEHRNAKYMQWSTASWTLNWTSPAAGAVAGNQVRFYAGAILGSGTGSGGDVMVQQSAQFAFSGGGSTNAVQVQITQVEHATCFGSSNGACTASATGGNGSFSNAWSNGQTNANATNLAAGTYTVTVHSAAESATATVTILAPPQLQATIPNVTLTCSQPVASFQPIVWGGVAPYQYSLPNAASPYTITVTDAVGCTVQATAQVEPDFNSPNVDVTVSNLLTCADTQATLVVLSNTSTNLSYLWSTGATTNTIQVQQIGTYTVTVTNTTNGCSSVANAAVNEDTTPPQVFCTGTLFCSGVGQLTSATAPFNSMCQWSINPIPPILTAGTYTVTCTSAFNGCTSTCEVVLTAPPPISVTATVAQQPILGNDGAINLTITSGTAPFSFEWKNQLGVTVSQVEDPTNLPAGTYSVLITDANGCTQTIGGIALDMVGTLDAETANLLHIYPSPAQSVVYLEASSGVIGVVILRNVHGQFVLATKPLAPQSILDVHDLPCGLYIISVQMQSGLVEHTRLVIQH